MDTQVSTGRSVQRAESTQRRDCALKSFPRKNLKLVGSHVPKDKREHIIDPLAWMDTLKSTGTPKPVDSTESGTTPSDHTIRVLDDTSFDAPYSLIRTPADLDAAISDLSRYPILGVDTETTGLDPHSDRLRLVQVSTPDRHTYLVDCTAVDPRPLAPVLERATIVGHHLGFDMQFLVSAGFPWTSVNSCWDTMLAATVLDSVGPVRGQHTLQALTERFLKIALPKEQQRGDWSG